MTVYCSCPGVLPLKAMLLCALHSLTLEKNRSFRPDSVFMYFKIILRESSDYLLKIKQVIIFFTFTEVQCNLLLTFVVHTQRTKHLIPKLPAQEEMWKCRCLDTQFLKLYLILYFEIVFNCMLNIFNCI